MGNRERERKVRWDSLCSSPLRAAVRDMKTTGDESVVHCTMGGLASRKVVTKKMENFLAGIEPSSSPSTFTLLY